MSGNRGVRQLARQLRDADNLTGADRTKRFEQLVDIAEDLDFKGSGLSRQDVLKAIVRLKADGVAALIVEQNVQSALAVADRVYVMRQGTIVHAGSAAALRDDPLLRLQLLGV